MLTGCLVKFLTFLQLCNFVARGEMCHHAEESSSCFELLYVSQDFYTSCYLWLSLLIVFNNTEK